MPDVSLEILFSDGAIAVVNKPAGVVCEDAPDGLPALIRERMGGEVFTVHRLDRGTAGLVVYARNQAAAANLSRQFAAGEVQKEYLALLCGVPEQSEGELRDLLFFDRARGKSYVVTRLRKGVKEAVLGYRVIASNGGKSLVAVTLGTGRTHQIRVQFASRGLPLAGDRAYGGQGSGHLALFCRRLAFCHPQTGERLCFEAQPDGDRFTV